MEMDLQKIDYNSALYEEYIHGSAEVVGLMCLQVFTEEIKYSGRDLEFQKQFGHSSCLLLLHSYIYL